MKFGQPKWAITTVKGCRRWLRTSAKNRAKDWRKSWLTWRANRYEAVDRLPLGKDTTT